MAATHLQKITTRAKQIRKAHPKMIWTDAVKKASKELAGKKVGAVKKKTAPKKAAKKKPHTKWGKVASHKRRVAGSKKHTDTKSHNVNIRVVSGIDKVSQLRVYRDLLEREKKAAGAIEYWRKQLKTPSSEANKKHAKSFVELTKKQLAAVREQIRIQKRLI